MDHFCGQMNVSGPLSNRLMALIDIYLYTKFYYGQKTQDSKHWAQAPTSAALRHVLLKGPWGIRPCVHAATWAHHHQSNTLWGVKRSHWKCHGQMLIARQIIWSHLLFSQTEKGTPVRFRDLAKITGMGNAMCLPPLSPRFLSPTVGGVPTKIHDFDLKILS